LAYLGIKTQRCVTYHALLQCCTVDWAVTGVVVYCPPSQRTYTKLWIYAVLYCISTIGFRRAV